MAVTLGKRKRRADIARETAPASAHESVDSDDDARALFQKAFEAKFKPLEVRPVKPADSAEDLPEDDETFDSDSDWSGVSAAEDEVEVIVHKQTDLDDIFGGLKEKKTFMSSKPPSAVDEPKPPTNKATKPAESAEDGTDNANLKNDMALQRLLKESHLLDASAFRASSGPEGKDRIKALDMRLQDLGAKKSALQQDKMSMSIRRGISGKAASREAFRRKDAAENGVILEKPKLQPKSHKRRERGVGGPGIGKMQGGTLKLSSRDVKNIQGPPRKGRKR